jgi:hypothetical protein|tara:strand:+ start:201 stop:449 length:249 start_codon:yes stop_codon:yes gene_type:complete
MNLEPVKKLISNFINSETTKNQKIYYTLSLGWIIFIGYLTWWNGLRNPSLDKSFRWDEWIWFGLVPALSPYLFYFIWKKKDN